MSLKEIIGILESEKNKLQKENVELKKNNYELAKKVRELNWEIKKLTVKLNALKKVSNEVADKPVVEGGSVPPIHTVTVGNGEGINSCLCLCAIINIPLCPHYYKEPS